ncbi:hypothetical protein LUZ60_010734 [Juncus effusus]|nr:hypothetical protein LUZ60_010734 [Juncus effusus]
MQQTVTPETPLHESWPPRYKQKNKKCLKTCCFITIILILLIIFLVLFFRFYLFKIRAPKISASGITLENFAFTPPPIVSINITLGILINVKNPNYADFNYKSSDSTIFYHGTQVGLTEMPAGLVKARSTALVNTTVHVDGASMITSPDLVPDLGSGFLSLDVYTSLTGKVVIIKIFKIRATVDSVCTVTISLVGQTSTTVCTSKVHLKM